MKHHLIYTCIIGLLLTSINLQASKKTRVQHQRKNQTEFPYRYILDSMKVDLPNMHEYHLIRGSNGLIVMDMEWTPLGDNVRFDDTIFYNRAFLPVVFDGKILPPRLNFIPQNTNAYDPPAFHLISPDSTFAPLIKKYENVDALRKYYYTNSPQKMIYNGLTLAKKGKLKEDEEVGKNLFLSLIKAEDQTDIAAPELVKFVPKRIYWTKNGDHAIQVAQNHISDNWYKGGNSSFFVRNAHRMNINYLKDKISFNTIMEWRLNVQKTPADTVHNMSINDDLLRLYNEFGLKAFEKWSYSANLDTKTQVFHNYNANSRIRRSSFASPLYMNFGLGMRYNLDKKFKSNKNKNLKLSLNLSPLSSSLVYVRDELVDVKRFGIEEGKVSDIQYGSSMNTDLVFNFNRYTNLTSRFRYFTNYSHAELEFENRLDLALNRYFSTTIFLYLRFDDNPSLPQDDSLGYFQINQMLSFGLTYKW